MRGERPYHMLVSSRKLGDFRQPEPDIGPSVGQIVLMNSGMCRLQRLGRRHQKPTVKWCLINHIGTTGLEIDSFELWLRTPKILNKRD